MDETQLKSHAIFMNSTFSNLQSTKIKTPLLSGGSISEKRAELKSYFQQTWSQYESLFRLINQDEAYFLRPEPLRHPLIFYFGHTATFYINKLILGRFIKTRINPRLEAICAVGVDEMSWDDLNSAHYDWPNVSEVSEYRQQVVILIESLIDDMDLSLPIQQDSLAWIILMGCEHERIHIETSSVIMRMLPLHYLTANSQWQTCQDTNTAPKNELLIVQGKTITFGKPETANTFGWDNEYGFAQQQVADFHASKYTVSNQEFLQFIKDGGYQELSWWTEEGQHWLAFSKAQMPHFWFKKDDKYWQRNLLNEMPLPLNWPVEVSYLEAKAFCQWKSAKTDSFIRLPVEAEWLCLRDKVPGDLNEWQHTPGNLNSDYYASSCPIDRFDNEGFYDIVGNVWQWSESAIDGFNGFEVHPLYDDFSTPTFDGKHNLIKGGSWISTGNEAIKHSRYAFRRHFFQHAGFRYVQSDNESIPNLAVNQYENDIDVCQQLENHYGKRNDEISQQFPRYINVLADSVIAAVKRYQVDSQHCLDLGCSVGGTSFLLAQHFNKLDGVDFSARYIQHGVRLQQGESVRYITENEGDIVDFHEVDLAQCDLPNSDNIKFSQGDAGNLKKILTGYNVIVAQNVLENSYDPRLFLQHIHQRLAAKGLLIVVSTYQFNERIADKSKWLGGIKVNGENMTGFDGLSQLLIPNFTLLEQCYVTRAVKQNNHNYHVSRPHVTVWQLN